KVSIIRKARRFEQKSFKLSKKLMKSVMLLRCQYAHAQHSPMVKFLILPLYTSRISIPLL
ncbi:amidase family protein, partial [Chlamydia psittaci 84-8471/1]